MANVALVALLLLLGLAFFCPAERVHLADRIALLFLTTTCFVVAYTPLHRSLEAQSGGATFLFSAAMFVVYGLARRVVPEAGPSIRFAAMPNDEFIFPYAAYIAVIGAVLVAPYWWKLRSEWPRALLGGIALIALVAGFSFWLLSQYYPVGTTQRVDPSPLPTLLFLLVEYGAVALLCRAAGSHADTRRFLMKVLPLLLLALWARFHFFQPQDDDA